MASSVSCRRCGTRSPSGWSSCSRCGKPLLLNPPHLEAASAGAGWHGAASPSDRHTASGALVPGTTVRSRFQVQRKLGEGGMGAVYLVRDLNLAGRACALKELTCSGGAESDQHLALRRFAAEAEILATLSHPGVPQIYDRFTENGRYYILMEYVAGLDLMAILSQYIEQWGTPLPEAVVMRWALQLCEILDYLHTHQPPVIHRDLKPTNLILVRSGRIKVVDFGIARPVAISRQSLVGTVGYAAPEQYRGESSPRSDLYALGICLHHLLTGLDPQQAPPDLDAGHQTGLSPTVAALLDRLVALDPQHRPPSAESVREMLERAVRSQGDENLADALTRVESIVARGLGEAGSKPPNRSVPDSAFDRCVVEREPPASPPVEQQQSPSAAEVDGQCPLCLTACAPGSQFCVRCGSGLSTAVPTVWVEGEASDLLLRVPLQLSEAVRAQPVELVTEPPGTRVRGLILTQLSGREWDYVFLVREPRTGIGERWLAGAPVEAYRYGNGASRLTLQAIPSHAYLESAEVVRCWRAWLQTLQPLS